MATPRETNLAVKQGLDALFGDPNKSGSKAHIFAAPIETAEDLLGRGLLDETGTATPEGVLFTQLQDFGMFDERGALTPKGQAYSMSYEEVVSGGDRTLPAYKMRMEDGIDKPPVEFSEALDAVGEFAWDAVTGLGLRAGYEAKGAFDFFTGKSTADVDAKIETLDTAIIEGSMKANFELAGLGGVMNAHLLGLAWDMAGADEVSQTRIWKARQNRDKIFFDNQSAKIGETLEDFTAVTGEVERQAQNKDILGKKEFDNLSKKGGSLGEFVDITVAIPGAAAAKAGSTVSKFTRLGVKADNILARGAIAEARIAEAALEQAALSRAATTAGTAAKTAQRMADDLAARFEQTGDQVLGQRARAASEVAQRNATLATRSTAELAEVTTNLEKLTAQRAMLGTRLAEGAADKFNRSMQLGRQAKGMPFTAVANVAETLGKAFTRVDDGLRSVVDKFGADKAYGAVRAGIGFAGFTVGGIPGAAVATGILSSGKMLKSVGNFSRVVGKEMMKARGQIPFWQRVANRADTSPVHRGLAHLMDTATLGGAVPGAVRRTARGVMAAFPLDLAFEFLADDGDINANTFKQALAESLVIGGSSAMAGGAFVGSKARHRQLAIGDEMNFRADMIDPTQKALFGAIPSASRRAIATYAASNPQLNFNFTVQGASSLSGNTATVNVTSKNPLKALIGHEVMHHVVIRNQMEDGVIALMIGDGEAGGLLRSNDGTLDRNFQQFWDEYQARMGGPVDINTAALEYYVDSAADHFSEMAESGELGALSGRTEARRMMGAFIDATLPRIPLARDLHMKMGGLKDMEGRMVMGSGLLSDGIRELPAAKALTKAMLGRSAGRSQGAFSPLGQGGTTDGGVRIPVQKGDKAVLDKLISIFETEEVNGKTIPLYDQNGDPIMLNAGTDAARAKLSVVLGEAMQTLRSQGKVPKAGELFINDQGKWQGNYLGEDVIRFVESRNILNKEQIRILKNLNNASRNFNGSRFTVINHPATKKVGKKVRYATLAPTLRDVVPVAVIPTKDGNLLVGLMSVTQLMQNIDTRGDSKRGKKLYQGNKEQMLNDVSAVMEMHRQNQRTDAYFDEKYGADKGAEYKNFINTLFGLMTPSMRDVNPMFESDKVGPKEKVYKTYRVDRISQATKMTGDTHIPMPFSYDRAKINLMPNGLPTLDANGDPVVRNMPEPLDGNATNSDVDYRGQHTAPNKDGGSPLHDLSDTYPADIYSSKAVQYYGHSGDHRDGEAIRVIQSMKGKPNAPVKIYRAVPKLRDSPAVKEAKASLASKQRLVGSSPHLLNDPFFQNQIKELEAQIPAEASISINQGDWVTTVRSYAKGHGESALNGEYKIIAKTVKARDIFTNGDSIFEFGYDPQDSTRNMPERMMPEASGESSGQNTQNEPELPREGQAADPQISLREPQNVGGGNEKTIGILAPFAGFGRADISKPWVREERSSFADIDGQEAELAVWAANNGRMLDVPALQEIRAKGYETRRGNEHDVVFAPDGVYRFTNGDKYGMHYRTPAEYLARWDKSNKLFPETAVDFVGFYQKPSGVGVIVTRQPFIKGKRGTAKQIKEALKKSGFKSTGNHSFRSKETGIELYDAHEDNVLFDAKGNIMPFDVWVNDPNGVLNDDPPADSGVRNMPEGDPLEVPQVPSGAAVKTMLKHSKQPRSFEASNATVLSPGVRMLPEPVYHGTPHKVDKFSLDKIGSGEGAQAYGWGLYFAENRNVGEEYAKVLGERNRRSPSVSIDGVPRVKAEGLNSKQEDALAQLEFMDGDLDATIAMLRRYEEKLGLPQTAQIEYLESLKGRDVAFDPGSKASGNLYTVKLLPDEGDFLDWDKPLSEQSEKVRAAFKAGAELGDKMSNKAYAGMIGATDAFDDWNGSRLYSEFVIQARRDKGTFEKGILNDRAEKAASEALRWLGIPGIRYLDGNSRSDGKGSYNYVIFDANDIEIIKENDKPVDK